MVIIRFPNGGEWFRANWVFRRFLEECAQMYPGEMELNYLMEQASALGGLFIDSLPEECAAKIVASMKRVAKATVTGELKGWLEAKPSDHAGQEMYLAAIAELLSLMSSVNEESGNAPNPN